MTKEEEKKELIIKKHQKYPLGRAVHAPLYGAGENCTEFSLRILTFLSVRPQIFIHIAVHILSSNAAIICYSVEEK